MTTRPEWWKRADKLHRAIVGMRGHYEPYSVADAEKIALALAGEVGEVAQLLYKRARDDLGATQVRTALVKELSDVRIYLALLFEYVKASDVDVSEKLTEVEERWRAKGLVF